MPIKVIIFLTVLFAIPADAYATEHVRGHMRKDGKYITPHNRTNANNTQRDNWSSMGNSIRTLENAGIRVPKNK